jgi:type II restriction/modification system DNA methylase subunit YeeA
MLDDMFSAMATKGGRVGNEFIAYFNSGLFDGQAALPLDEGDLGLLTAVGSMRWAEIDPSIFGTLFERFLDPAKRAQIGAHYTDAKKILQIVDPVVMRPLEAEWTEVKERIEKLVSLAHEKGLRAKEWAKAEEERGRFVERLASLRILDPACGSGNFLYMALQRVKDLEFRVINECEKLGLKALAPRTGPEILFGIEINRLAAEIARTTIWIGDIQWGLKHALYTRPEPVLRKLDQIECRDAVLTQKPDGRFAEAHWPAVDFIIGNPPFLGGKVMRAGRRSKSRESSGLGDEYVDALFTVYEGRVPAEADFVCYWFAKAWEAMQARRASRAGLVATNSIRGGANRRVLDSIAGERRIFEAWSDEPWIIEGAAVRVSLLRKYDGEKYLDGHAVQCIYADLTGVIGDITQAKQLAENGGVAFMGDTKGGSFDVPAKLARGWLSAPFNPNGRPNGDVLKPWVNGLDLTRRPRDMWIIDFGWTMSEMEAAFYEGPFAYILEKVKPKRAKNRRDAYRLNWWRHVEARPAMWAAIRSSAPRHGRACHGHPGTGAEEVSMDARHKARHDGLARYVVTPTVAKHRLFGWLEASICADHQLIAIARDDDTTFGILHSRFHEAWSLRLGTSLEDRPRYTPTTTFETFPFPEFNMWHSVAVLVRKRRQKTPNSARYP